MMGWVDMRDVRCGLAAQVGSCERSRAGNTYIAHISEYRKRTVLRKGRTRVENVNIIIGVSTSDQNEIRGVKGYLHEARKKGGSTLTNHRHYCQGRAPSKSGLVGCANIMPQQPGR